MNTRVSTSESFGPRVLIPSARQGEALSEPPWCQRAWSVRGEETTAGTMPAGPEPRHPGPRDSPDHAPRGVGDARGLALEDLARGATPSRGPRGRTPPESMPAG